MNYQLKPHRYSSHWQVMKIMCSRKYKKVLDIGCADGYLEKYLKNQGVTAEFDGVDWLDKPAFREYFGIYTKFDLNSTMDYSGLKVDSKYDCILCMDVLEHLYHPEAFMAYLRKNISTNTDIIFSVPNVAYLLIRLLMLAGYFEYADAGIMDRTHVRFYTLRGIRQLLRICGFRVGSIRPTIPPVHLALGVKDVHYLNELQFIPALLWKTLFAYQFVIVGRKQ